MIFQSLAGFKCWRNIGLLTTGLLVQFTRRNGSLIRTAKFSIQPANHRHAMNRSVMQFGMDVRAFMVQPTPFTGMFSASLGRLMMILYRRIEHLDFAP